MNLGGGDPMWPGATAPQDTGGFISNLLGGIRTGTQNINNRIEENRINRLMGRVDNPYFPIGGVQ